MADTTKTADYMGRDLKATTGTGTDYLGRANKDNDHDYLGRALK